MEGNGVQKLSKLLMILVTAALVCNLFVLVLVPGLAQIRTEDGWSLLGELDPFEGAVAPALRVIAVFFMVCWMALPRWWMEPYVAVLTVFLWVCGSCTAVILWQARRVLETVMAGAPFQDRNAWSMGRAAVCFFIISAASLVRMVIQLALSGWATPYNAVFIPIFAMGGLLCLVMAALFRQAAALKEDNDLTI